MILALVCVAAAVFLMGTSAVLSGVLAGIGILVFLYGWRGRDVRREETPEEEPDEARAQLLQAAEELALALSESLPEPEQCQHQFSKEFESKMQRLLSSVPSNPQIEVLN